MPRRVMDYPSVFSGWHSLSSSGHLLTVMGMIFFCLMLIDSFFENKAPQRRFFGIARVNTRLSFYAYEIQKLHLCRLAATKTARSYVRVSPQTALYKFC